MPILPSENDFYNTENHVSYQDFSNSKLNKAIENDEHAKNLLLFLNECFQKRQYCDVTIKIDTRSFDAHRVVLAMFSDYFRVYMQHDGKDKDLIIMNGIDADIFYQILLYAYTGHVATNQDTIEELTICADYLGVQAMKDVCENNLIELVSLESCFYYWQLSDMYTMKSLFEVCCECFRRNFITLIKKKEFFELSSKYLMIILEDSHLKIYNSNDDIQPICSKKREESLLKAVLKYIDANLNKNHNKLTTELLKLLESVKLPYIDSVYLKKQLKKHSSLMKHSTIKHLLGSAKMFKSKTKDSELMFPKSWYTPRLLSFCKFSSGRKYGSIHSREEYNNCCPVNLTNIYRKIIGIKLFFRRWDGRLVLGGITLQFDDGCVVGGGESQLNSVEFHEICLKTNEVIKKVTINSGWLIDRLKFKTNIGKTYGPYGGDGGGISVEQENDFYLHSISFFTIRDQTFLAPLHFQLHWIKLV